MVRVLLFGRLRDLADWRERHFDPRPPRLFVLKAMIGALDARLAAELDSPAVRAAVNRELALEDCDLEPGAEVAFLPPMSGG